MDALRSRCEHVICFHSDASGYEGCCFLDSSRNAKSMQDIAQH